MDLNELQNLMENLYGEDDRDRGLPSTVAWLCEEVGELAQAVRKGSKEEQLHDQMVFHLFFFFLQFLC